MEKDFKKILKRKKGPSKGAKSRYKLPRYPQILSHLIPQPSPHSFTPPQSTFPISRKQPPSLPPSLTHSNHSPTSSEHIDSHPSNELSTPCRSPPYPHTHKRHHNQSATKKKTSITIPGRRRKLPATNRPSLCVDRQALDGRKMPCTNSPSDHVIRDGNSENAARAQSICAG